MNINAMMKQAKKMQDEMEIKQKELDKKVFLIEKQGIKLEVFGNGQVKSIKINDALIDPEDPETLEDMIIISFNEANLRIQEAQEEIAPKNSNSGLPI
jgi:DNA-binding YbaB/EbfC family protein